MRLMIDTWSTTHDQGTRSSARAGYYHMGSGLRDPGRRAGLSAAVGGWCLAIGYIVGCLVTMDVSIVAASMVVAMIKDLPPH
jgi:hypothetical protein